MSRRRIEGSFVALITPFNEDGSIDYGAFRTLLDFRQRHGTRAILFMGSTVEARGHLAVRAVPDRGEGPPGSARVPRPRALARPGAPPLPRSARWPLTSISAGAVVREEPCNRSAVGIRT